MSDDELHEFDLSAWEAPPPAAGLADAVIARLREPVAVAALEQEARAPRWWWIGGAVVAAAAVAIVLVIALGGRERAAPTIGVVAADRARPLELGATKGELDTGAVVAWHPGSAGLVVEQRRGNATWRVAADEHVRIDPGATGALVEATGASLRVEVHMNFSDARVIGATALTAAAVALVTVVVYEGHVKVTSGGQTVQVEPGATVQLRGDQAPKPPDLVGDATAERVRVLEQQVRELKETIAHQQAGATIDHAATPGLPVRLDRDAIAAGIGAIKPRVMECPHAKAGIVKLHVVVAGDGNVKSAEVRQTPEKALGECVAAGVRGASFAKTTEGGTFTYPFVFDPPPAPPASCDADALKENGMNDESQGQHAAALAYFEQALRCKADARGIQLAYMASCNAGNVAKAKLYYKKLSPDAQSRFAVMCYRHNISKEMLEAP